MKKESVLLLFVVAFIVISLSLVAADGGYFPHPGYYVSPGQQSAVIFHENNVETMIVTSDFTGNAKDLVWIIPTPSKPEVTKASEDVFSNVQKLINIQYNYPINYGGVLQAATKEDMVSQGVVVIESKQVDYYDVNILLATDGKELVKWFNDNNYSYPDNYAYILRTYIDKGWYFTAIKVSTDALTSTEVGQDLKQGHPTPVKMVFLSDKIVFPLKISAVDFKQNTKKHGSAKDEAIGATREDSSGNIWTKVSNSEAQSNWKIVDNVPYGYENLMWGDSLIDQQPGGISYIEPYYNSYIPIYLYVFSDGKYEAGGDFYNSYGNWVTKKQIEKLGSDENGKPYIEPKNTKYFFTYLTANLQKSQMDNDLVLTKADDNKKVNAGPEAWETFLRGLLIGFIAFVVWVFTPIGLLFIAGTLILFLTSNRTARIFGWIMEIFSLAVTAIFLIIFLVITASAGSLGNYIVLSILITSLIVLAVMVFLIVLEVKHKK